jgi:hypothetical protein
VYARRRHDRGPLLAHGSLGALRSQGSSRIAYARQIKIVMRPATIISILRESHLPFSKNDYNSNRPHTSLCVPNFIRIDYVIESPKVSGDDRSVLPPPDPFRPAVKSKSRLEAENAALRRQLIILRRKGRERDEQSRLDEHWRAASCVDGPQVARVIFVRSAGRLQSCVRPWKWSKVARPDAWAEWLVETSSYTPSRAVPTVSPSDQRRDLFSMGA